MKMDEAIQEDQAAHKAMIPSKPLEIGRCRCRAKQCE